MNLKQWRQGQSFPIQPGAIALMMLMAATRFHHFGTPFSLPDASLAVFFLAGLWFGSLALFAGLLLEAGIIDYLAITQFNVSDFCISPAYVFLIPTYAAMWFGGTWSAKFKSLAWHQLMKQFAALMLSTTTAFLISNGSFYLLSGRYIHLSWAQYLGRAAQYYPPYISSAVIYAVTIFAAVKLFSLLPIFNSAHKTA